MNTQRNNIMKTTLVKSEKELINEVYTLLGDTQNHMFIRNQSNTSRHQLF